MANPVKIEELSGGTQRLLDVLNGESDISMVIVAAAFIDQALGSVLLHLLAARGHQKVAVDLLSRSLQSLHSRTQLAHCLGVISKQTYSDIERLAQVRNKFAHEAFSEGFESSTIQKVCAEMMTWRLLANIIGRPASGPVASDVLTATARNQFKMTAVMIHQRLVVDAMSIELDPSYRAVI